MHRYRDTEFQRVGPNIFGIITAFFLTKQMCITSYAKRRKSRITGPFTCYTRIVTLSTELAACHPSGAQNLEVTPRFFGKFVYFFFTC